MLRSTASPSTWASVTTPSFFTATAPARRCGCPTSGRRASGRSTTSPAKGARGSSPATLATTRACRSTSSIAPSRGEPDHLHLRRLALRSAAADAGSGGCQSDASRLPTGTFPNRLWTQIGTGNAQLDPALQAQSSDEIVVGGEYEILEGARLGVTYTKRWQNRIIEDMSTDEAATFFVGNPGHGLAKAFPAARRDYDAVTVYFDRAFRRGFLAQASYTVLGASRQLGGPLPRRDRAARSQHEL